MGEPARDAAKRLRKYTFVISAVGAAGLLCLAAAATTGGLVGAVCGRVAVVGAGATLRNIATAFQDYIEKPTPEHIADASAVIAYYQEEKKDEINSALRQLTWRFCARNHEGEDRCLDVNTGEHLDTPPDRYRLRLWLPKSLRPPPRGGRVVPPKPNVAHHHNCDQTVKFKAARNMLASNKWESAEFTYGDAHRPSSVAFSCNYGIKKARRQHEVRVIFFYQPRQHGACGQTPTSGFRNAVYVPGPQPTLRSTERQVEVRLAVIRARVDEKVRRQLLEAALAEAIRTDVGTACR